MAAPIFLSGSSVISSGLDLAMLPGAADLILVACAALAGSLLSALTGSGAGVVLSIALLPILGVRAIVPVLSVAMVISHIGRLYVFRKQVDWRAGSALVLLALPGSLLGTLIYARLPERATAAVLGIFLAGLIVLRAARPGIAVKLSPMAFAICAGAFGILNGLTIGAGILVLPLLMTFGLAGAVLVATDALVGLGMNLTKAISLGIFDVMTPALLAYGIAVGVLTVPGAFIARAIIDRLSIRTHTRLIDATVALAAASMLWRAAAG
jgi:uncharacterized membrane protein YfcA